jgi:autotransporter translocation and assembly factor TamB
MSRRQRIAVRAGIVLGSIVLALMLALLVLTTTDWGRERVRGFVEVRLNDTLDGHVDIGRLEGRLLHKWRLVDVSITDLEGRPFIAADTLATRFSLRGLLRQRIVLQNTELINGAVVLDQPPGEDWNFVRILPEPDTIVDPPGWGDWIRVQNAVVVNSRITIRSEWKPDPELSPAEREQKIAEALDEENRANIQRVEGGFQNIMDFREISARFDDILIADPDEDYTYAMVAALRAIAQPYRPPAADVRAMEGKFYLSQDSLWFDEVRAQLPGSALAGAGVYHLETADLHLRMAGAPAAFPDLRWLYPRLPEEGGGDLILRVHRRQAATRLAIEEMDVRIGDGVMRGDLRFMVGDTFRILPTDLEFENLDSRPVAGMVPGIRLPVHGTLDGRLALQGDPSAMRLDGDVALTHAPTGRSRVVAEGVVGMTDPVRFSDLRLTLAPLRTDLLREYFPRLPRGAALTGTAALTGDMDGPLRLNADLALDDPATGRSRVLANGVVDPIPGGVRFAGLDLGFQPLRAGLVRPELSMLPPGSTITGRLRLDGATTAVLQVDGELGIVDPATGESRVAATGGLDLRDGLQFRALDLRFRPLRGDLVRGAIPELPPDATVTGRLQLDGDPDGRLRVDGDLALDDPATGVSRVAAAGEIDRSGALTFRGLDLRLHPLQLPLVHRWEPNFPLGGTLEGTARLDGRPGARLAVRGDLTHREAGETSRVVGFAEVVPGAHARVDVQLLPLSLVTAGRFAPEAELRGEARGHLQAAGDLGDLRLRADLAVPGGGEIVAEGWLDLASDRPGYDLTTRLHAFNLAAVTGLAPAATDLTGRIDGTGRGFEPATMRAEIRADLVGSAVEGMAADEVHLRVGIADGLARVDTSFARIGETRAWADGEFGLVAWRDGALRFQVRVDPAHTVSPWLPGPDTGVVALRPAVRQDALAEARAAAERAERRRLVELLATGQAPSPDAFPPPSPVDTLVLYGIPRQTVEGWFAAEGVITGNIELFDLEAEAEAEELVFRGQYIGSGEADVTWIRRNVPRPILELDASAERLIIEGFAMDSAEARIRHYGDREGAGTAVLAVWQDDDTDYRANVEFTLARDRGEVLVHDMELRLDTLTWTTVGPGTVAWSEDGVEVDDLQFVSDGGGMVALDGRLPIEGEADLQVVLREFELAHIGLLLQDEADISGRVSLEATMQGTLRAPTFDGVAIVADAGRNGAELPDIRVSFAYAGQELAVEAELFEGEGRAFAHVDASLPIDLGIVGQAGPRLLPDRSLMVDVRADSLPLDALPALTDEIEDASGIAAGQFFVRGTWNSPQTEGQFDIWNAELALAQTGVRYRDVAGSISLAGPEVVVDSLVGHAGGPVRVTGTVSFPTLARPGFDLAVSAENAWVMRTSDLRLRIDADLAVTGPFERVVVTGQSRVRQGVIYVPETRSKALVSLDQPELLEEIEGRLRELAEDYIDPPSPLLANLEVDVDLHIEPDTWIRSTDYNVEVYTPPDLGPLHIQLDQQAGRLTVEGTVNSDRGHYSFMGRRFVVARGAATFVGATELNPILQVTAEHEVQVRGREDFSIRVVLGGTLLEPTITLETDARPPIPETDIFTYVALGRTAGAVLQQQGSALSGQGSPSGDLVGNVAGLATFQMAALAANMMLDQFESEMARELGLDVLHIAPADLPGELFTGRFADLLRGTQIEAGRYIGPRFFAAVRARPTTETWPGGILEYSTPTGYRWNVTLDPRFLPPTPTLREVDPERTNVFGALLFREWRF